MAGNDRRIDFMVAAEDGAFRCYVEVKTVRPAAENSAENWQKYQERKGLHPENVTYHAERRWLGAQIYGNSFSARTKFMEYARGFETRLTEANEVHPGRGLLVFCGRGFEWELPHLVDFADFYRTGTHREGDAFANMEAHELAKAGSELKRNIAAFGFMQRRDDCITECQWIADVRGV